MSTTREPSEAGHCPAAEQSRGGASREWLPSAYLMIAELLLSPNDREGGAAAYRERLRGLPDGAAAPIGRFLADERSFSEPEYVEVLELSPPCPLYLGAYLFEEPTSCRGLGSSGRNAFMIELIHIYEHFGFRPRGGDLPDHVPLVAEFLGISLDRGRLEGAGLRRRLLERFVQPPLEPLRERLEQYESPYAWLVEALEVVAEADRDRIAHIPAWELPTAQRRKRSSDVSLRVLNGA